MGAKHMIVVLVYLLPSFVLLTIAHAIARREINKRNKNFPVFYNEKGKRCYLYPPQVGVHVVFVFIATLLWALLFYLLNYPPPVDNSNLQLNSHPNPKTGMDDFISSFKAIFKHL